MKAYDLLIPKLALDKKLIKHFSSYRSLNIWNFGFFQNFLRKKFFSREIGMPAQIRYLQMKAYKKLHKINIRRIELDQRNEVKN